MSTAYLFCDECDGHTLHRYFTLSAADYIYAGCLNTDCTNIHRTSYEERAEAAGVPSNLIKSYAVNYAY